MPSVLHWQVKGLKNRAENSHQPTRERERQMCGFKSAKHAQQFLAIFSVVGMFFRVGRHLLQTKHYRELIRRRFAEWRESVEFPVTT
jgi:putative transposase